MLLLLLRATLCGHYSEYWKFSKNSIQVVRVPAGVGGNGGFHLASECHDLFWMLQMSGWRFTQRRGSYSNQIRARGGPGHCLHGAQPQTVWKQTVTRPEERD